MQSISIDQAWEARAKLASYADLHSTAAEWYMDWETCPYCNGDDFDSDDHESSSHESSDNLVCLNCGAMISPTYTLSRVYIFDNTQSYADYLEQQCKSPSIETSTSPASSTPSAPTAESLTTEPMSFSETLPSSTRLQQLFAEFVMGLEKCAPGLEETLLTTFIQVLHGSPSPATPSESTTSKTPPQAIASYAPTTFY